MEGMFVKLAVVILIGFFNVEAAVEEVDDSELVNLITGESNLVVLFTKNSCDECDNLDSILKNIRNVLKEDLDAVVVKASNSHMVNLYSPSKEPALVYFRRGIPLLYYGSHNAEEILQVFSENREPIVKELSDINFEHLTQAASGATTGDWYLFFYSAECVPCLRLHAMWEAVGAHLKLRLNVARIDRLGAGTLTAKRFGVEKSPEFILLRKGKFYRYKKKEYTPEKMLEFVEKGFMKESHPEIVPPEKSGINNLSAYIQSMQISSQAWILCFGLLIILGCIIKYLSFKKTTVKRSVKKTT